MQTDTVKDDATAAHGKVSLPALTALVVGSMIGGGIFGLPSQMAQAAAPGPLIIGWIITGVGMLFLALVYQRLSRSRPDLEAGVYSYARAGFGDYIGFSSAWGYWVSAWLGNVSYLVLLMASIGVFLPGMGDGNTALAIVGASVLLWVYAGLIALGVKEASFINAIITVGKILPLLVFIVLGLFAFRLDIMVTDFWGTESGDLGNTISQIKNMMLVTVWVFIGVEGASVFSERARKRHDVGRATIVGFASVLALLLAVNLLSYGIAARPELAKLADPSLAGVLTVAVGSWGAKFVAVGLIISLIGALLSWFLFAAEVLRVPAVDGLLPAWLGRQSSRDVPVGALMLTVGSVQVFLILAYFNSSTYTTLILLASALILLPYLLSALYQIVYAVRHSEKASRADLIVGGCASVYALWLLYAAGLKYLLFIGLFYLAGTPFFVSAKRARGKTVFQPFELVIVLVFAATSIAAIVFLSNGQIAL